LAGENGVHAFAGSGFVLKTAPSQTITVRDDSASKSLISSAITVNFAPLDHFTFNAINSPQVAGTGFSITITAKDVYGNTVTSYTTAGTLSDLSGSITPTSSGTFTSGVRTVTVTVTTTYSGDTISISGSGKSGTSNAFTVNAGSGTFGYATQGSSSNTIVNLIRGSMFTSPSYSTTAQSISAYIQVSGTHTISAAIYTSTGTIVGSTQEVSVTTSNDGWVTFNFASGPQLAASTNYILVVWANTGSGTAVLYGDNGGTSKYTGTMTYGTWPNSVSFSTSTTNWSIYCTYSVP
jgi:hypothetical protein